MQVVHFLSHITDIIGHTRPIEPVTQAGQRAVPAQMAPKQRSVID